MYLSWQVKVKCKHQPELGELSDIGFDLHMVWNVRKFLTRCVHSKINYD